MTKNFPYFKSAPDGWKNSVRHNLTMNKYFEKIEKPGANGQKTRKGSLWSLNPQKLGKMEEEIIKWRKKDLQGVLKSMSHPEKLETIEQGNITSTNYMQFSRFQDPDLFFETNLQLSDSETLPSTSQVAAILYPTKQMVKMAKNMPPFI